MVLPVSVMRPVIFSLFIGASLCLGREPGTRWLRAARARAAARTAARARAARSHLVPGSRPGHNEAPMNNEKITGRITETGKTMEGVVYSRSEERRVGK